MKSHARSRNLVLVALTVAALLTAGFLIDRARRASAQEPAETPDLDLFVAPSHVGPGERWIILGAGRDLPDGFVVLAAEDGVVVKQVERLSARAVAALLQVPRSAAGSLLTARIASLAFEEELSVRCGTKVPPLVVPANFGPENLVDGRLIVRRDHFLYGYLPGTESRLAAVRIYNRQTGRWHRREIARERAAREAEARRSLEEMGEERPTDLRVPEPVAATEGEGREPSPDFIGVKLAAGLNVLDIVAEDEHGNLSWETLEVVTTATPRPEAR